jgi:hypothetical protein
MASVAIFRWSLSYDEFPHVTAGTYLLVDPSGVIERKGAGDDRG